MTIRVGAGEADISILDSSVPVEVISDQGTEHHFVVTNTNDTGAGSLRAAIEAANALAEAGTAVITFAIPETDPRYVDVDATLVGGDPDPDVFVMSPQTELPALTRGDIVINGQSQQNLTGDTNPFGPEIVLEGSHAVGQANLQGLVSRYRLDGTVEDDTGNNEPSATSGIHFVDGLLGQGVTFEPGGYIEIPDSEALDQQIFTLSAWVRPDGPGPNDDVPGSIIIAKGLSASLGGNFVASVELAYSTQIDRFVFGFGNLFSDDTRIISADTFAPGEFYHVAATYDGATFRLYVKGQLQGEKALAKTIFYDPAIPWTIGSTAAYYRSVNFPRTWNGVIDEVGIYNRALSADEIESLAHRVDGLQIASTNNLVHGLTVEQFSGDGLLISADNNTITGNYIGTNATGDGEAGNDGDGVHIVNASGNLIGGLADFRRNVISGNAGEGIKIIGEFADQNVIEGNFIGLNASGTAAVGNRLSGIFVPGSTNTQIINNVVSGNLGFAGIAISVVPKKGSGVLFFFVEVLDHNMLVWRRIENHNMLEREKWI